MIKAASQSFSINENKGVASGNTTYAPIESVHSPIKTTVTILSSGQMTLCLVASHILNLSHRLYRKVQCSLSCILGIPKDSVVVFCSHNHTSIRLSDEPDSAEWGEGPKKSPLALTATGKRFFRALENTTKKLAGKLEPVTIWWALGSEGRISYNRKGRRANGSTYLIREEDRLELGQDFNGDIDREASLVCLKTLNGQILTFLTHFTAHPCTAFHPEHPCIFGDYPQVACDLLSHRYSNDGKELPVSFLQGCAGEINSKGMLTGDIARSSLYGDMLGHSYIAASNELCESTTTILDMRRVIARVPYAPLPNLEKLRTERNEIKRFIKYVRQGNENTLECLGLNLSRSMSLHYRAAYAKHLMRWNTWAMSIQRSNSMHKIPKYQEMELCIIRIGDIVIAGLPCEPFVAIGRQIRSCSPFPMTLACGYTNVSYGYVPDSGNIGDQDYQSAFYRFTKHPDYRRPGGDALARSVVRELTSMYRMK